MNAVWYLQALDSFPLPFLSFEIRPTSASQSPPPNSLSLALLTSNNCIVANQSCCILIKWRRYFEKKKGLLITKIHFEIKQNIFLILSVRSKLNYQLFFFSFYSYLSQWLSIKLSILKCSCTFTKYFNDFLYDFEHPKLGFTSFRNRFSLQSQILPLELMRKISCNFHNINYRHVSNT